MLSGCAGGAGNPGTLRNAGLDTAARDALSPGNSLIYVHRTKAQALWGYDALIFVDGKQVAALRNNGCVAIPVTPGPHRVGQQWHAGLFGYQGIEAQTVGLVLDVPDGKASYVQLQALSLIHI